MIAIIVLTSTLALAPPTTIDVVRGNMLSPDPASELDPNFSAAEVVEAALEVAEEVVADPALFGSRRTYHRAMSYLDGVLMKYPDELVPFAGRLNTFYAQRFQIGGTHADSMAAERVALLLPQVVDAEQHFAATIDLLMADPQPDVFCAFVSSLVTEADGVYPSMQDELLCILDTPATCNVPAWAAANAADVDGYVPELGGVEAREIIWFYAVYAKCVSPAIWQASLPALAANAAEYPKPAVDGFIAALQSDDFVRYQAELPQAQRAWIESVVGLIDGTYADAVAPIELLSILAEFITDGGEDAVAAKNALVDIYSLPSTSNNLKGFIRGSLEALGEDDDLPPNQ